MLNKVKTLVAAMLVVGVALPASAQYVSVGVDFLKAVRDRDGGKAIQSLRDNGSAVVNYRDDRCEAALHDIAGRRDSDWLGFMLSSGGDPNIQTSKGDTPLHIAARSGWLEGANMLLRSGARVDLANRMGETPLIVAVQQRQAAMVKRLLEAGANADKSDSATGRSARDYAKEDRRSTELLRLIESVKPAAARPMAGPKL